MRIIIYFIIFCSPSLWAGAGCSEKITAVILHQNGNVYFKTNKVCSSFWCQIKYPEGDALNRTYSLLLAARTSDKNIQFYWGNLNNCEEKASVYESPKYLSL